MIVQMGIATVKLVRAFHLILIRFLRNSRKQLRKSYLTKMMIDRENIGNEKVF